MSFQYTPTATYHPLITLPEPGDEATAQSVNEAAMKFIADNAALAKSIVDIQYVRRPPSATSRGGGANYDTSRLFYPASALGNEGVNSVIAGVLSSDVAWTIDDTGCVNGDWFFVYNASTTYSIAINTPHVSALKTLAPGDWCMFERSYGDWGFTDRRIASEPLTVGSLSAGSVFSTGIIHGSGGSVSSSWDVGDTLSALLADVNRLQVAASKLTVDTNGNLTTIGNIIAAALTLSGALNVAGGMQVSGPVQFFNGLSAVLGAITANAGINVIGASTLDGLLTCLGGPGHTGRIVEPAQIGATADTTYSPLTVRRIHVPPGTISTQVRYTVSDTGCSDGDWMEFSCLDSTDGCFISLPGGTYMQINGGGLVNWCRCERINGSWYFIASGPLAVNV